MNAKTTFRIDLPTLFADVNEHRRREGLAAVEPAVMAVRASIKFAIRRQKYMNLNGKEVDVSHDDARHLCEALGELFNVDLRVAPEQGGILSVSRAMTAPEADEAGTVAAATPADPAREGGCQLPLFKFYAAINKERRVKRLLPVEPAVISVRTGVKFAILRRKLVDFQATRLDLDADDLKVLEAIIAQQFDVNIPGGLTSLCERALPQGARPKGDRPAKDGVVSRLMGRLVGNRTKTKHYPLDTNNLLLAILRRRATMGHKPISPGIVREKCAKALGADLELEIDMHDHELTLSGEQIDAFGDIIRKEFEIMFDDLSDLLKDPDKTQ